MNMWQEYLLKLINMKKQEHMEPIQRLRKWKAPKSNAWQDIIKFIPDLIQLLLKK